MSRPFTVFIADDDDDDAQFLTEALQQTFENINIERVSDGYYFLKKLKQASFDADLIFLDLNMPLRRGLDCLNAIKSQPAFSAIPVIVFSTSKNIKDIDACYKAGAHYYLLKPDSFRSLKELIKTLHHHFSTLKDNSTSISKDKFVLRHIEQN